MSEALALPRAEVFLRESQALAQAAPHPEHRALLALFVLAGRSNAELAPLLVRAARAFGCPDLALPSTRVRQLLGEVAAEGPLWGRHPGPALAAERLGDLLFEAVSQGGDLRLIGLALSYGAERWAIPYPCLRGADGPRLHAGRSQARLLMGERLREAIYSLQGELLTLSSGDAGAGHYRGSSGASLLVEWHELQNAEEAWRASAPS